MTSSKNHRNFLKTNTFNNKRDIKNRMDRKGSLAPLNVEI